MKMSLADIRQQAIAPALALLPANMNSPEAEIVLLTIGLQESLFQHRRQIKGPARSFWQAEKGGGMIAGLLNYHDPKNRKLSHDLCIARGVKPVAEDVYAAIEFDDVLAAGLARLLLWTDPARLPREHDVDGGFAYLRTWRPGAYERGNPGDRQKLRDKWAKNWAAAVREVIR
jgi:hypothetical protein